MGRSRTAPLFLCAALVAVPAVASADDTSSSFFADGQKLMAEGKFAEACPKFEKALLLNPGAGTKFNLADCYVKIGKLASALVHYREVENVTRQVGQQERSAMAKEKADALEPKVPTVIVRAPWLSSVPSASITLDGRPLTAGEVEKPIKVDFGEHVAIAKTDEQHQTRAVAKIGAEGEARTLALDSPVKIETKPAGPTPSTNPEPPKSDGTTQRIVGASVAGIGAVAMVIGGVMALSAKSTYDTATEGCGTQCPNAKAGDANDAITSANVGGVVLGAGLAFVVTGAVIFFVAPKGRAATASSVLVDGLRF